MTSRACDTAMQRPRSAPTDEAQPLPDELRPRDGVQQGQVDAAVRAVRPRLVLRQQPDDAHEHLEHGRPLRFQGLGSHD